MTGTGSAVFGLFDDEQAAKSAKAQLAAQYSSVFLVRPAARQEVLSILN